MINLIDLIKHKVFILPEDVNFQSENLFCMCNHKQDYKLYSAQTVVVVIQDYVVYYNIDSQAFVIVDTTH